MLGLTQIARATGNPELAFFLLPPFFPFFFSKLRHKCWRYLVSVHRTFARVVGSPWRVFSFLPPSRPRGSGTSRTTPQRHLRYTSRGAADPCLPPPPFLPPLSTRGPNLISTGTSAWQLSSPPPFSPSLWMGSLTLASGAPCRHRHVTACTRHAQKAKPDSRCRHLFPPFLPPPFPPLFSPHDAECR